MKLRWHTFAFLITLGLLAILLVIGGCYQGKPSKRSPIHINPNMDWQPKVEDQEPSPFFADGRGARPPVEGTIARGELRLDDEYYTGISANGDTVVQNPLPITMDLIRRGQERYGIYCTPCHGGVGDGKGIIANKEGMVPPTSLHEERLRNAPDGHFFNVITHGLRNMQPYNHQIPIYDRWAIVAYVRALQISQNAPEDVVPADQRVNTN